MTKFLACAALALSLTVTPAFAQDTTSGTQETSGTKHHKKKDKGHKAGKEGAALNNTVCPVSGQDVNAMGHPYTVTHNGQKVTLCCEMCKDKFMADADNMTEKAKSSAKK